MELRQIQHFMQLYNDKNVTRASHNLYISQQGLSKSISKLEGELGFPLFDRSTVGVVPTERAVVLYEHFEKVTMAYRDLMVAIEDLHENKKLTIIAPTGFALTQDRTFLSEYREKYPDVNLIYEEHPNKSIPLLLQSGKAEIAYMYSPLPDTVKSYCVSSEEPYMAILSKNHKLSGKKSLHLTDLNEQNVLLLEELETFNDALSSAITAGHVRSSQSSYAGLTEYLPLIQTGAYVGFAPASLFRYYDFPDIMFVPLKLERVRQKTLNTHLVTADSAVLSTEANDYIASNSPSEDTEEES